MSRRLLLLSSSLPFLLLAANPSTAQESDFRYAYVHEVQGQVTLQRASEQEPEAGAANVPILPGDRLWTHSGSRAEVRYADGALLRLDSGTKVDFVDFDSQLVRLWSGSVILKCFDSRGFRIDAPGGSAESHEPGTYRVDVDNEGALTLSVFQGAADLSAGGGSVSVSAGESGRGSRTFLEAPYSFNTAELDDFDLWSDGLDRSTSTTRVVARGLPPVVSPYASELSESGDWVVTPDYGYVWYPQVSVGLAPYQEGRWCYTRFGYTWASNEPWGWAPYHYGRWGYNPRGWYWIPGNTWGPAWVSFAVGPFWVGWSPLGYQNYPVFAFDTFVHGWNHDSFHHGGAYPGHGDGCGWNFATRDHFGGGTGAHMDAALVRASVSRVEFLDPGARLDRNLNERAPATTRAEWRDRGPGRERFPMTQAPTGGGVSGARSTFDPSGNVRAWSSSRTLGTRETDPGAPRENARSSGQSSPAAPLTRIPRAFDDSHRDSFRTSDRVIERPRGATSFRSGEGAPPAEGRSPRADTSANDRLRSTGSPIGRPEATPRSQPGVFRQESMPPRSQPPATRQPTPAPRNSRSEVASGSRATWGGFAERPGSVRPMAAAPMHESPRSGVIGSGAGRSAPPAASSGGSRGGGSHAATSSGGASRGGGGGGGRSGGSRSGHSRD